MYVHPSKIPNKISPEDIEKFESFVDEKTNKNKIIDLHQIIRDNGFIDNYLMLFFDHDHDPISTHMFDMKIVIQDRVENSFMKYIYGEFENIKSIRELNYINNIFIRRIKRIRYTSSLGDDNSFFTDNLRYGDEFQEVLDDLEYTLDRVYNIFITILGDSESDSDASTVSLEEDSLSS